MWELDHTEGWAVKNLCFRIVVLEKTLERRVLREDSWESLGLQGDQTSPSYRESTLYIHWKDWCWSWRANVLATWCKEPTHWKIPWCWEKTEGRRRRRWQRIRRLDSITDSTELSKLWETVKGREAWHSAVIGSQRVRHDLPTDG